MKSPAFQFYPADYTSSQRVRLLTLEEEGAYINLLCSCWLHGSIPSDPIMAARLVGKGCSTTVAATVLTMFAPSVKEGRMIHERLERERAKQSDWREKSASGGRKSAELRKAGSTTVQPHLTNGTNQSSTLQSSSSSTSSSTSMISKQGIAPGSGALMLSSEEPAKPKPTKREPTANTELLHSLVRSCDLDPAQVTPGAWSGYQKSLSEIKAVCPNITEAELKRRAANYRTHMGAATLTPFALTKHWALCDKPNPRAPKPAEKSEFSDAFEPDYQFIPSA